MTITETRKKLKREKSPDIREISQKGVPDVYGGEDLRKRKALRLERMNDGVMTLVR